MGRRPIEPVVWRPPRAPRRDRSRPALLRFPSARTIALPGFGPEDVVADATGQLICGLADGRLVRVDPAGHEVTTVASTGGRPIGLEVSRDGRILVCDARLGLLRVDPADGSVETLVSSVDGVPLIFCSNAAEASDGTIYFTESSSRFSLDEYRGDLLEHRGTGRLLARHPDGAVEVVLGGLHFANGVALTVDEGALILAETGAYQLSRVELHGPRAGRRTVIAPNLAGFPDNISRSPEGLFWVAMAVPRNALLDALSPLPPLVRQMVWRLPDRLQPKPARTVWVIAVDDQGELVHELQGRRDDYHFVTGVVESGSHLYLASLEEPALLEVDLAEVRGRGPA